MYYRRVVPVLVGMSLAGVVWAAVLIIALLAGVRPLPQVVAASVAAALVIPGFIASAAMTRSTPRRLGATNGMWQLLRHLPGRVLAVAGGLFFAFWIAGMTALA